MSDYDDELQRRQTARENTLSKLGELRGVLSRGVTLRRVGTEHELLLWPGGSLGKIRMVDRDRGVLLVTDGVSDPWNAALHSNPPEYSLDVEFLIEVPKRALSSSSGDAIATSWMPVLLWAMTDWVVAERLNIKGVVNHFQFTTLAVPPVVGLESLVGANGFLGVLLCNPAFAVLEPLREDDEVWTLAAKLLTADEYDWAVGVADGSRARSLWEAFLKRGDAHVSWPTRPSILADPQWRP